MQYCIPWYAILVCVALRCLLPCVARVCFVCSGAELFIVRNADVSIADPPPSCVERFWVRMVDDSSEPAPADALPLAEMLFDMLRQSARGQKCIQTRAEYERLPENGARTAQDCLKSRFSKQSIWPS